MANVLYPKFKESLLSQSPSVDMDTHTIKLLLMKVAQAYNAAHQYVADLTAGNIVARSPQLTSPTVTDGVFDAADVTFTTPTAGLSCFFLLYRDTGADATSSLIAYLDTGTNLPVTTTGADVTCQWSNAATKIFAL
jgi:hypothetical protein